MLLLFKIILLECKDLISNLLVLNPKQRYTIAQIKEHPWYTASKPNQQNTSKPKTSAQAKLPEKEPIDDTIIEQMVQMGINKNTILDSLATLKFDQFAGIYNCMLLQKRQAMEGTSSLNEANNVATREASNQINVQATEAPVDEIPEETEEGAKKIFVIKHPASRASTASKSSDDNIIFPTTQDEPRKSEIPSHSSPMTSRQLNPTIMEDRSLSLSDPEALMEPTKVAAVQLPNPTKRRSLSMSKSNPTTERKFSKSPVVPKKSTGKDVVLPPINTGILNNAKPNDNVTMFENINHLETNKKTAPFAYK